MYEYMDGRIASRGATRLVLDVHGIGYDVNVPLGADFKRAPESGRGGAEEIIRVWTHFVVREDAQLLFGFADENTRALFRLLLKVRGVGPGLAQGILSSLSAVELLEAIAAQDPKPLTRIKGVGKKTADQILLDLRGHAPPAESFDSSILVPAGNAAPRDSRSQTIADAISALASIGYTEKQAETSVTRAAERAGEGEPLELEQLVRAALRE